MGDLNAITRSEKLMDGQYVEPITRKEKILAGEELEPVTREEYFLKKYRGGGSPEIDVVQLSVTENGDYTAPSGKAYSPVHVAVPEATLIQKNITANGNYNASSDNADGYSSVSVNVPLPSNAYLLKEIEDVAIASFDDGADLPMPKLKVAIEPQQDLHGYDAPWVGGAGKNKLNINNLSNFSNRGIDFVVAKNSSNAVISVSANGTVTGGTYSDYYIVGADGVYDYANIPSGSYILNGAVSSNAQIYVVSENDGVVTYSNGGDTNAFNLDSTKKYRIFLRISGSVSNIKFYPMIRLATVSDATFAPYSNICPISGWDECNVTVADDLENPTTSNVYTIDLDGTRYGGTLDVVSGVLTVTYAKIALADISKSLYGNYQYGIRTISNFFDSIPNTSLLTGMSNTFVLSDSGDSYNVDKCSIVFANGASKTSFLISTQASGLSTDASITEINEWLRSIDAYIVYPLATPLTIQLTSTMVKSLLGQNNIFADCGNINELSYFGK